MNKKNTINYPKSAAMGFFSKGLKNEFETVVVRAISVRAFEVLLYMSDADSSDDMLESVLAFIFRIKIFEVS